MLRNKLFHEDESLIMTIGIWLQQIGGMLAVLYFFLVPLFALTLGLIWVETITTTKVMWIVDVVVWVMVASILLIGFGTLFEEIDSKKTKELKEKINRGFL